MSSADAVDTLNRVLAILRRSFVQYARHARPYIPRGRERAMETIYKIADEQDALAERVSHEIAESGALPDSGEFPMEFTDTHDLDFDYLIRAAIGYQQQDIADLKECAESLQLAPAAKSLVEEALGMAKGHLESLEELTSERDSAAAI